MWGKLFLVQYFKIFNSSISCFRKPNLGYDLDCSTLFDALLEALCLLPIDKQPVSEQLLTQLLEAEELYRKNRKTMAGIKLAQFRYQASLEEIGSSSILVKVYFSFKITDA